MRPATQTRNPPPLNVLFIGNSFTARNNLPEMVGRIASAGGSSVRHRLISAGGASLRRHWNGGEARRAIETGDYDYVVLQEQSTLPVKNPTRMRENVRLFDEVIRAAGAKTALYMTWARQHAPETQELITRAYTEVATQLGATMLPVGVAWQRALGLPGVPPLYDRDGSHPTTAGSYLAACVIYLALANARVVPTGIDVPGLDGEQIAALSQAALAVSRVTPAPTGRRRA